MVRTSLFALVCALGLTVAPEACAMEKVATAAILYEMYSLFNTWTRDPKPDRTQRSFITISPELFKKDQRQWLKNLWHNIKIFQEDYVEGQGFKDTYLKVKGSDENIKASRRKCLQFGFNGNLLSYLAFIGKTRKSMKDVAFVVFAFASLKGGGLPWLNGNAQYRNFFRAFGWEDPNAIILSQDEWARLKNNSQNDIQAVQRR